MGYKLTDNTTLKGATAALIDRVGGLQRAADASRVGVTTLCRYQDPADDKCFMPVDVVLSLELHCGAPVVTQFLAARNGSVLTPIEPGQGDMPRDFAALSRDAAMVFAAYADAIIDGEVTAAERRALVAAADALIEQAGRFRRDLQELPS